MKIKKKTRIEFFNFHIFFYVGLHLFFKSVQFHFFLFIGSLYGPWLFLCSLFQCFGSAAFDKVSLQTLKKKINLRKIFFEKILPCKWPVNCAAVIGGWLEILESWKLIHSGIRRFLQSNAFSNDAWKFNYDDQSFMYFRQLTILNLFDKKIFRYICGICAFVCESRRRELSKCDFS